LGKNGPSVGDAIKKLAGLQDKYQSLLKEKTAATNSLPINKEHKEIIELVVRENQTLDLQKLKTVLAKIISIPTRSINGLTIMCSMIKCKTLV